MAKNIAYEMHPPDDTSFYCNDCDSNVVEASDLLTGKFFGSHGHVYNGLKNLEKKPPIDGNYVCVIFAVCSECLNKES